MAVFRVEKTRDYTVMSNHHLKNRTLSLKAKGLLSLMLSLPDDWDFTMKGLAAISAEGIDAIRQALAELEKCCYVVRARTRDEKGYLRGSEYVIYEQPQMKTSASPVLPQPTTDHPALGKPTLENPILDNPTLDNPTLGSPTLGNPTQLNTNVSITHLTNNRNGANPYPIHQPINPAQGQPRIGMGLDEMGCAAAVHREAIHRRIDYDVIVQDTHITQGRLDEIVDLMVETLCATNPTMTVAGIEVPTALVQERLNRINSQHIQYVFHCLNKTTSSVRNIKKYLLAVLFNAPSTMDGYYAAVMNRDFGDVLLEDNYDFLSLANE